MFARNDSKFATLILNLTKFLVSITKTSNLLVLLFFYRGAELIEELSRKQILKQQEVEKAELKKIKNKMDSIKAAQKKIQGIKPKEITTHAEGMLIRFS